MTSPRTRRRRPGPADSRHRRGDPRVRAGRGRRRRRAVARARRGVGQHPGRQPGALAGCGARRDGDVTPLIRHVIAQLSGLDRPSDSDPIGGTASRTLRRRRARRRCRTRCAAVSTRSSATCCPRSPATSSPTPGRAGRGGGRVVARQPPPHHRLIDHVSCTSETRSRGATASGCRERSGSDAPLVAAAVADHRAARG